MTPRAILQHTPRKSGYVTQADINRHGSFRAALACLNASTERKDRHERRS